MNARAQVWLWIAQRASAAVLAVCGLVHLVLMIDAVRGGRSAAEILGRTSGNAGWLAFYGVSVVSVAVHGPIGLRNILTATFGWRGTGLNVLVLVTGLALLGWGGRAVWAVYAA